MPNIIQVRLGCFRAVYNCRISPELTCNRDDCVIIKVDRGLDFGFVLSTDPAEQKMKGESLHGDVLRVATEDDRVQITENEKKAREAIDTCNKKIAERKLEMNIVASEYTFDGKKIIFFFTAEDRVDFRNLVKDLARIFKVRIELKQIGVRDKAKIWAATVYGTTSAPAGI